MLGLLWIFMGISGLFMPLDRPILIFGRIHTDTRAYVLHIAPNIVGIYLGYGLLKAWRHIRYVYAAAACFSTIGLSANLLHESKMWELYLLIGANMPAIPRLVAFTKESHYLFIATYILTAMYVYSVQPYSGSHHHI